jgi:hypothetical protein
MSARAIVTGLEIVKVGIIDIDDDNQDTANATSDAVSDTGPVISAAFAIGNTSVQENAARFLTWFHMQKESILASWKRVWGNNGDDEPPGVDEPPEDDPLPI